MAAALLAGWLVTMTGCGNGLARVAGQITLDGEPIAGSENVSATVCFYPEDGIGSPAVGRLDSEGKYYITTGAQTGLEPGKYIVTVRASEFQETGNPNAPRPSRLITPRDYNNPQTSGLLADVGPGSNELDFDLVTPAKTSRRR